MRAPSTSKQAFPELEQIEAILQEGDATRLQSRVLCRVPCGDDLLPVYALTLGSRDPDVPCVTYVAGLHGLERIGTQVVIAFLEGFLERLKWDRLLADILQRVRIHFDAFAARLVSERQWHPSQSIKRLADGELELTMTLGRLEEVERWVLSWGEHARVLEPDSLRKQVRSVAKAILEAAG